MTATATLLILKNINQVYGRGERRFTAIADVNLVVEAGEFVALLGPSGCGKSTLLRIITGIQPPTRGQILYGGQPLTGVNPRATIVFQSFALFPWLTVQENVEVALQARRVPAKLRTTRALDLLDRVGLDGFETAYPRELSGGMRQKVGFARAMAVEPELLCLDEPFSALDVLSAEALRDDLLELWHGGHIPTKAILLVTHNIEEAVLMADRIVVMHKDPGRIIAQLPVDLSHPRKRKTYQFLEVVDAIYGILAGHTQPEDEELGTAPGEPGLTRGLPHIGINDLSKMLEFIAEEPGDRADIYRLAEEFKVRSDAILHLLEAAELLGFASIAQGDITLTPLGETFGEASILARKEIFATRLRRLPLFKWLITLLAAADKKQLRGNVVQTALELEFHPKEAQRQLETAIAWGRYAEILSYDVGTEVLYLEPGGGGIPPAVDSGEAAGAI